MATAPSEVKPERALAIVKNETVDIVMKRVTELQNAGRLRFPPNYSPENALMSAYLVLQNVRDKDKRPALQVCSRESVANALMDMVVQGLNPSKQQGYFIVYGSHLVFQRSYFGTVAVTKRVARAQEIYAECIYEGDEFEYAIERGNKRVTKHTQSLKSINKDKIIGAYCTIVPAEGEPVTEIMTMDQIRQAWRQSRQDPFDEKGNLRPSSVHAKFTEEMAQKTVTTRACKLFINSSMDDSLDLVVHHMNRADDAADEAAFAEEVAAQANQETIDAEWSEAGEPDPEPDPEPPAEAPKPEPEPAAKTAAAKGRTAKRQEPDW